MSGDYGSYPWYTDSWRKDEDVLAMNAEQRDVYRELLDMCWAQGSLPCDERALLKMSLATEREWKRAWPVVQKMFEERDGRLWNHKVDEKRPDVMKLKSRRQRGAELTNDKRWANHTVVAERIAERTLTDRSAVATSTSTSVSNPPLPPKGDAPDGAVPDMGKAKVGNDGNKADKYKSLYAVSADRLHSIFPTKRRIAVSEVARLLKVRCNGCGDPTEKLAQIERNAKAYIAGESDPQYVKDLSTWLGPKAYCFNDYGEVQVPLLDPMWPYRNNE
jgi:uncharacterized protein YdaU (DUF1376 family)